LHGNQSGDAEGVSPQIIRIFHRKVVWFKLGSAYI